MNNLKKLVQIATITLMISSPFLTVQQASADEISAWQGKVGSAIVKKQIYPRAAMRDEIEGRAKIKVNIDRSGQIQSYDIIEKTGQDVLDNEIPKLMERLNPLPTPPASMTDAQLSFILPVAWRIQ